MTVLIQNASPSSSNIFILSFFDLNITYLMPGILPPVMYGMNMTTTMMS